jgi:hypothetical protein
LIPIVMSCCCCCFLISKKPRWRPVDQGGALVVQLEPHAPARARLLAAAFNEILDGHFRYRSGLLAGESRKLCADIVSHVGGGDLAQLVDHPIGGQPGALGVR